MNHHLAQFVLAAVAMLVLALLYVGFGIAGLYDTWREPPIKGVFAAVLTIVVGLAVIRHVYRTQCK